MIQLKTFHVNENEYTQQKLKKVNTISKSVDFELSIKEILQRMYLL